MTVELSLFHNKSIFKIYILNKKLSSAIILISSSNKIYAITYWKPYWHHCYKKLLIKPESERSSKKDFITLFKIGFHM